MIRLTDNLTIAQAKSEWSQLRCQILFSGRGDGSGQFGWSVGKSSGVEIGTP